MSQKKEAKQEEEEEEDCDMGGMMEVEDDYGDMDCESEEEKEME